MNEIKTVNWKTIGMTFLVDILVSLVVGFVVGFLIGAWFVSLFPEASMGPGSEFETYVTHVGRLVGFLATVFVVKYYLAKKTTRETFKAHSLAYATVLGLLTIVIMPFMVEVSTGIMLVADFVLVILAVWVGYVWGTKSKPKIAKS